MLALLLAAATIIETPHYRLHAEGPRERAVNRRAGTSWQILARVPGLPQEKDGSYKLRVTRRDGRAFVEVGGKAAGDWEVADGRFGLAIVMTNPATGATDSAHLQGGQGLATLLCGMRAARLRSTLRAVLRHRCRKARLYPVAAAGIAEKGWRKW